MDDMKYENIDMEIINGQWSIIVMEEDVMNMVK